MQEQGKLTHWFVAGALCLVMAFIRRFIRLTVNLAYDQSPHLPFLPFTHVFSNLPNQAFLFSSISSHGRLLKYNLGSPMDYGSAYSSHPQFVSIDPTSGRLVFNTSHVALGDYNIIIIVTDLISDIRVAMDILITVNSLVHSNSPPYWINFSQDEATSGPYGRYVVSADDTLSINLTASDGDNVTLIATTSLPGVTALSNSERVGVRNTGAVFPFDILQAMWL